MDKTTIPFESVLFSSDRDLFSLHRFLEKLTSYSNYDHQQPIQVFCNRNKEFTAFESVEYAICYTSKSHKLAETMSSPYEVSTIPFSALYERVCDLLERPRPRLYHSTFSHQMLER